MDYRIEFFRVFRVFRENYNNLLIDVIAISLLNSASILIQIVMLFIEILLFQGSRNVPNLFLQRQPSINF